MFSEEFIRGDIAVGGFDLVDLSRGITAGEFYNGAEFSACAHAQNIAIFRDDVIFCFVFTNKNDNICRKFLGKICDFRTVNSTYIYVHF